MFKRLFGKKNDGFYMQADESKAPAPLEKAAAAPKATAPTAEKIADEALVETKAAPAAQKAETAAEESPKATKTSIKDKKKAKGEKKATPTVEVVSIETIAASEPAITNFATDYLIKPSSNSNRRRPGANMKQFMDMARQVEIKKSPGQRAKSN